MRLSSIGGRGRESATRYRTEEGVVARIGKWRIGDGKVCRGQPPVAQRTERVAGRSVGMSSPAPYEWMRDL